MADVVFLGLLTGWYQAANKARDEGDIDIAVTFEQCCSELEAVLIRDESANDGEIGDAGAEYTMRPDTGE